MLMKTRALIVCLFLAYLQISLHGQTVQLTIIPGSEYTMARRDEWKVMANNTTNQNLNVFFYGLATELQDGKIYEVRSKARLLAPGITTFNSQYYVGLDPFDVLYQNQSYRQYAIQTNGLPAGDYEICITAYSAIDSSELGSTCYNFSADYYTPPILISPDNNDTVREDYPFFTWLPPAPSNGQNFVYTLNIYELQNIQTTLSSVQTNPAWYQKSGIPTTISQYGINARNFRNGKRYAWYVTAYQGTKAVASSEVWSFVFNKENMLLPIDSTAKKKEAKKNLPDPHIPYLELKAQTGTDYHVIDNNLLSFQLINNTPAKNIGYRIVNSRQQVMHTDVLDAGYGFNYYSLDLKTLGSYEPGKFYELQVTDPAGNINKARFKLIQK